jgi:hypothetical protein
MHYSFYNGSENVCTKCNGVIDDNQCVNSCPKLMAPNKDNICKECIKSYMIYRLDDKCIVKCPSEYDSKDIYQIKNICLLRILNLCSNYNKCENDGICSTEFGSPTCICKNGYFGESCESDEIFFERMKISLNTNIKAIIDINPSLALTDQQVADISTISNLIQKFPELATNKINDTIANIVLQQNKYVINGSLPLQDYTFYIADLSLGIKNAM